MKMDGLHTNGGASQTTGRVIHWASLYDTVTGLLLLGKDRAICEMTVELAQVKPGDKVLDVGCGTGSLTITAKAWAGPDGEAHGIDAAPEMIEVARRKAARLGVDIGFQVGLVEDIPFPDGEFDVVLSRLVLHHLPDDLKRRGVAEMRRVLKPGGRFLAVDFTPPTNPWLRGLVTLLIGHGMMRSDVQKLLPMLEEAGFTGVEVGKTRYSLFSFARGVSHNSI
jgi:demethylmenaquinone methyltransferase/2-methoxy-6-polyprenyl-1,4-benzoquinol methylase/phosphoethanolamine N-methyltransferase